MAYRIHRCGESRSFPDTHALLDAADAAPATPAKDLSPDEGAIYIGVDAGTRWLTNRTRATRPATTSTAHAKTESAPSDLLEPAFTLIELGTECLGEYTGDDDGPGNVLGFARFRLGEAEPTDLVELVKKPFTTAQALAQSRKVFEDAGLTVAVCNDFPGRILDRLIRPYYNAALRRLDEGLASAQDMDTTLRLGLGYPEGPIELLARTGLHHHYAVSHALHAALGQSAYVPARRAQVAWARQQTKRG